MSIQISAEILLTTIGHEFFDDPRTAVSNLHNIVKIESSPSKLDSIEKIEDLNGESSFETVANLLNKEKLNLLSISSTKMTREEKELEIKKATYDKTRDLADLAKVSLAISNSHINELTFKDAMRDIKNTPEYKKAMPLSGYRR